MFDHLLESSHRDDSNKWSNIRFGEEIGIIEMKICTVSGAMPLWHLGMHNIDVYVRFIAPARKLLAICKYIIIKLAFMGRKWICKDTNILIGLLWKLHLCEDNDSGVLNRLVQGEEGWRCLAGWLTVSFSGYSAHYAADSAATVLVLSKLKR